MEDSDEHELLEVELDDELLDDDLYRCELFEATESSADMCSWPADSVVELEDIDVLLS